VPVYAVTLPEPSAKWSADVIPETARFVVVAEVITPLVANKLVDVAAVVVERVSVASARVERPETVTDPSVPTDVSDEFVTPAAKVLPVSVPAGAITALVETAVIRPLPFTVKDGIAVDEPKEPVSLFTVARVVVIAVAPEPLISPDRVIV
jgi:hypothetical protein